MFWGVEDYSNRSLTSGQFGKECTQDLSRPEMEASFKMRLFSGTGPEMMAFQSDKHPISERGLRRWGLAIRNRYRGSADCQVTMALQMGPSETT